MVVKLTSNPRPRPCTYLQGRKRMGGSLPRPKMCIYGELTLPNGSSQERYTLFHYHIKVHSIEKSPHPCQLLRIALVHLSRGRDIDLSNVKARPARTSYCALLNVINFTIYFMRGTEEQANGTRIIPSLVTPPTSINVNILQV